MACELKGLQQAKTESEYKRKKVETQLQELTSRTTEMERVKGELAERSHKLQVSFVLPVELRLTPGLLKTSHRLD